MVEIAGENMRQLTWCVVEEITSGEWSVGGQMLTADDVIALAHAAARPREASCPSTMTPTTEPAPARRLPSLATQSPGRAPSKDRPHLLDPDRLPDHIDRLYRAAWALCGSRQDAEDLVQDTFANVLKRPRLLRDNNEITYLLRALRNTYTNQHRSAARRPATRQLFEDDAPSRYDSRLDAREIMQAIASAPAAYRDAVIAVDLLGLSYREAARSLRAREATVTTRLHRGRQHVAAELLRSSSAIPPRELSTAMTPDQEA